MATIARVAEHLDLSEDRVRQLQRADVLPKAGRGGLDLDECRTVYIRHLRASAAGRGASGLEEGAFDLSAERARLAKEQADGQAMKNEQLRGSLLPRDEVTGAVQAAFSRVKARLLAIPVKAAPMIVTLRSIAEVKAKLTGIVHEALAELASTDIVPEPPSAGSDDTRLANGRSGV